MSQSQAVAQSGLGIATIKRHWNKSASSTSVTAAAEAAARPQLGHSDRGMKLAGYLLVRVPRFVFAQSTT
ncbi:hypothetical protein NPJ88_001080 [Halomonas elongata]|uniref:hypothetical protein n=1 Tax=Halomonas elongata TaxID=2746 RepID=UPI00255B087F|nr:hypothetical protein [Halomonas elongata]MDL4860919.1 hypothetical protein [Halomonas elongata]